MKVNRTFSLDLEIVNTLKTLKENKTALVEKLLLEYFKKNNIEVNK